MGSKSAPVPSSIRLRFSPDALRAIREERGLTKKDLADILLCRRPTVTDWEMGYTVPTRANLRALAQALGVGIEDLLHEETASELDYARK